MAILSRIFRQCSNVNNSVVLQYNDIFFTPGSIALYNNTCWIDTENPSVLTPLADVTFNSYLSCEECINGNLQGVLVQNCATPSVQMVITFDVTNVPGVGSSIYTGLSCWEVISVTGANENIVSSYNTYESCVECLSLNPNLLVYTATTFVNCCDSSDVVTFYIIRSNFVYPFGNTVVYNNKCYYSDILGVPGIAIGTFDYPDYLGCNECNLVLPCDNVTSTPTPTPSVTPTHTPTLTPTNTTTPTPTKTPGLTPTASYTTTTTTRPVEKNECGVITLFPLGVSCETTNPSTSTSADGSIQLVITGGTAPYTNIVWNTGVTGTTYLNNLIAGTYSATVIDYYGDFTASTLCSIFDPTPTPTPSLTPTITPSATPLPSANLCVTFVFENNSQYQYQFTYYTAINNKPAWTANTYDTPFTTTGSVLLLEYSNSLSQWVITGFNDSWYPSSTSVTSPPLTNWVINGSSGVDSLYVTSGTCPTYTNIIGQTVMNGSTCASSNDGSICINLYGGSGSYVYSINGGTTTGTTSCFYNLSSGVYSVYCEDVISGSIFTKTVTVENLGINTTNTLTFNQTTISSTSGYNNTKYELNSNVIPNGTTVNMTFNLSDKLKVCGPGTGDNEGVSSYFLVLKNGVPQTLTNNTSSTTSSNRPNCSPNICTTSTTGATVSCSVNNTDNLTIYIVNISRILTNSNIQSCPTKVTNTMSLNTSFTYNSTNCTYLLGSGLNVETVTTKSEYTPL